MRLGGINNEAGRAKGCLVGLQRRVGLVEVDAAVLMHDTIRDPNVVQYNARHGTGPIAPARFQQMFTLGRSEDFRPP